MTVAPGTDEYGRRNYGAHEGHSHHDNSGYLGVGSIDLRGPAGGGSRSCGARGGTTMRDLDITHQHRAAWVTSSRRDPADEVATKEADMPDSVYRVTEVIGVSAESWEAAARSAVETAGGTIRDLRVAEVVKQDVVIENGQVSGFRVRLAISFKYDSGD